MLTVEEEEDQEEEEEEKGHRDPSEDINMLCQQAAIATVLRARLCVS